MKNIKHKIHRRTEEAYKQKLFDKSAFNSYWRDNVPCLSEYPSRLLGYLLFFIGLGITVYGFSSADRIKEDIK